MLVISRRARASVCARALIAALAIGLATGLASGGAYAQALRADTVVAREIAIRAIRAYYRVRTGSSANLQFPNADRSRPDNAAVALDRALDSATALAPGDSAIASYRVFHRVTTGQYASADALAAKACADGVWTEWWCSAIRGFTKYNLGDGAAADQYFGAALDSMSAERRCIWEDLSIVLNDFALTKRVKDLPCGDRGELNEMIWWLADPLWMVPGNERRAAHYARWTEATLAGSELRFIKYQELSAERVDARLEYYLRLGWLRVLRGYDLGCSQTGSRLDCS